MLVLATENVVQTIPLQTFYYVCFGFVTITCGLLYLVYNIQTGKLTNLENEVKLMVKKEDLKSVLGEVVGDKISKAITPVETKIDNIGTKLNTVAEDVAFLKGKEEVRREISTK